MSDDISIPHPGSTPARTSFSRSYRTRRTGMDENTRLLLMAAGGLGLLLLVGVGAWSVMGHHGSAPPVIEADSRPLRVKPDNPGGMQVVGANEQIMNSFGATAATDAMGPTAELPDPQALRAQKASPPARAAAPPTAAPAPFAATPASATPASATPASATPPSAPAGLASVEPAPAASAPATSPLPDTPAPRAASHPAPPAAPSRAATAGMLVQLAAVDSEQAAQSEWQRLSRRMPDLLGERHPVVQRAARDGKTFWRVRTGGFADTAEATAFCGHVRAKGGACSLASF